ncbi:MAG: S-layer homology domain-containing protein, partial [Candidatus Latescibacteria bacterium]|nr:S-layer homology domain-containing protein [Candidatus Latescibacterota bacterium]
KRLTIVLVSLFLILSGCALRPGRKLPSPTLSHTHYTQGMQKLEVGNLDGALVEFKKAQSLDKDFAAPYVGMSLVALEREECESAFQHIREAKRKDSRCIDAYIAEGRILNKCRNRPDWLVQALNNYEMALELAPENDAAHFYQGESYKSVYQFSKAAKAYKRVAERRGHFFDRASYELETVQKILNAAPQTKIAMQVGVKRRITRADLAALLSAELRVEQKVQIDNNWFKPNSNNILDITRHSAENWIRAVIGLGLVGLESFPDGTFKPDLPVTRGNFALVVQSMLHLFSNDTQLTTKYFGESSRFPDIKSDDYIYNAIALCVDKGFIQANADGSFGPAEYISGVDALLGIGKLRDILWH